MSESENPEELGQFEGLRRVRVQAMIEFEAYVNPDVALWSESVPDATKRLWARISHELQDAIEYRAPHLTDFEGLGSWDAMAVLVQAKDRDIVDVLMMDVRDLGEADPAHVEMLATGTAGEVF